MRRVSNSSSGFTLLELMIAAVVGLIVVGGALSLFNQAMKATWITSQKSELQQDFRAAANLLQRDISMAGAGALGQQGLAYSAVALPVTATKPVYPCSTSTCNYVNSASVAYPVVSGSPYIYSIIPGNDLGIIVPGSGEGASDILTLSSADVTLALNCYTVTANTGTVVTFQLLTTPSSTCVLPTNVVTPQALNDPVVGLQVGNIVLFGNNTIAVVTSAVTTCAPTPAATYSACYSVTFAASDPGHINQPSATTGSLTQLAVTSTLSAVRLLTVTYYLDISPWDGVTPRLMRIQSGQAPAPVAENVVYLKFTFDVNNNGAISANQSTLPAGTTPAMITKVNIAHMTMRSQLPGTAGYQGLDLKTSISARNLTSQQEYPLTVISTD
ncbi:MAG: prepilin-type N-terminal cleavage/methylation domain-containing protein [Candidatus Sulfotelmatobacter sp.]